MDAPEIDNRTDFIVHPQLLFEKDGEKLLTVVKATFVDEPSGVLRVADDLRAIRFCDEPWGDPVTTPPKYPCDICGYKPGTDVIIVATAHAPDGKPVPFFDVAATIGPLKKTLRIFGLRVWSESGSGLSAPRPVLEQELRYDHAWGGLDASDPDKIVEEARNPVGLGIARELSTLTHQLAPAIEDPAKLIGSVSTAPAPAGVGSIGPHWMPRRQYTGTYDDAWMRDQAPLFPGDRDDRANLCASPGLTASPPLSGGEEVGLLNLAPTGLVQFLLPSWSLEVEHDARERSTTTPHLDTVIFDTLDPPAGHRVAVELVWRTITRAPRRMKDALITVRAHKRAVA